MLLVLYEVKLIRYLALTAEVWVIIAIGFTSFLFGIITLFLGRSLFNEYQKPILITRHLESLFVKDGSIIKNTIIILSIVGLLNAIQHWIILINKFGSITSVLIQAGLVYRLRTAGEIEGVIPYLYVTSYIAIILSGIYTAYKNKITLVAILPFIAIIIKEIASFGRAGILIGFLSFTISFLLLRHALSDKNKNLPIQKNKKNLIIALIIMFILFVGSATIIKDFRGTFESYKASSSSLNKLEKGLIISPSIYLYISSHVGVLSKYFQDPREKAMFGENTFQPVYNFLSKFGIVEHPNFFQRGYWIPMWTNTGTYLREIHADFGNIGLLLVPYMLGFLITFYWFKFYSNGKMIDLIILTHLFLIVALSFLVMITRTSVWFISFMSFFILIPLLELITKKISTK